MKSSLVYEFLPDRTTESDSGSGPVLDTKANEWNSVTGSNDDKNTWLVS